MARESSGVPWPEEVERLLRPGGLAAYVEDHGWSYKRLALRVHMSGEYLRRVSHEAAPVRVCLAVMKATELTPAAARVGERGKKPDHHWTRVLQDIEPALSLEQCQVRVELAHPITGEPLQKMVEAIGLNYSELGKRLGVNRTQVIRAVNKKTPTGKGIQAALNLLYEQARSRYLEARALEAAEQPRSRHHPAR